MDSQGSTTSIPASDPIDKSSTSSRTNDHAARKHNGTDTRNNSHSKDSRSSHRNTNGPPPRRNDRSSMRDRDRSRGRSKPRDSYRDKTSTHPFLAIGSPALRLRERNNILAMHRAAGRRGSLSTNETATRVLGVDESYFQDVDNAQITERMGYPGVSPTNANAPEEQFRAHAMRNAAYVNHLPRVLTVSWHQQYSFFTDKRVRPFDVTSKAAKVIRQIHSQDQRDKPQEKAGQDHAFTAFLIQHVKRMDDKLVRTWLVDLSSGRKSLQELVQANGIPFLQWRAVNNLTTCPLLEHVVRYRPPFVEATWFIRVNVVYTEMQEIKRDSMYRLDDWFFSPKRWQRRAQGWTEQLVLFLHDVAQQMGTKSVENGVNGDVHTGPVPTMHQKWSYALHLASFQFKMSMLDVHAYFDGLLSLYQKALTPRVVGGNGACQITMGVNEVMELVVKLQQLLPDLIRWQGPTLLLVKTTLQHLRYLIPSEQDVPDNLGSVLQEELVTSLCQLLRDVLLNGTDILVRLKDESAPSLWPRYVYSDRFFDQTSFDANRIEKTLARCRQKSEEVSGRILRLHQTSPTEANNGFLRNEADMLSALDRFHQIDGDLDLSQTYHQVFASSPLLTHALPINTKSLSLVCEWAVSRHRPAEYRYLSAVTLIEKHSDEVQRIGREKGLLSLPTWQHQVVLQGSLQSFLFDFAPRAPTEVTQVIDLFCLLVRRRLFSVEDFVDFVRSCRDENAPSAGVVSTAYNIECGPGRGYKSSDILALSRMDKLRLYLWQLPRGACPLPTSLPMERLDEYDADTVFLRWLEATQLKRDQAMYAKTLERAQSLCIYVFHTHGQTSSEVGTMENRILREIEYQGKVSELVSAVKTMCGHDKGRFTLWFLKQVYKEDSFFRFSEFGSVEHILRLVCLVLELADILALLEVLVYFLRNSPVYLVKHIVIPVVERHEAAYCASGQIAFLMQAFVDRFQHSENADDSGGSIAKCFGKMYYAHRSTKEIEQLDVPPVLLASIANFVKDNATQQKKGDLSLEAPPRPPVRIPPAREATPPELTKAMSRAFKALQTSTNEGEKAATPETPAQSPDNSENSTDRFTMPAMPSWKEAVMHTDGRARDPALDFAAASINRSMAPSIGATNANATRERRSPSYIFFLRAVLSEAMDKWLAGLSARAKSGSRRPVVTPHYVHRCARLVREVAGQHQDGENFQEKMENNVLMWLQKEVIPAFAGSDGSKRKNPFTSLESSKEALALNQKGRLDRVQYGLKAFLLSLCVHKVIDLGQLLHQVLAPHFLRVLAQGRASRDPNLPSQLLAIALVYQLYSEPPQQVVLDASQKPVMLDEPLTKYHVRFLRSQVAPVLLFQLVNHLCQVAYQMDDNFLLRKREERGQLAKLALFNLTADAIVREVLFRNAKETHEKFLKPIYHKWHTAVLLTHLFRPPSAPAEDAKEHVQLLSVDQILDQLSFWSLNRVGPSYLDLQISRQQLKVKRSSKPNTPRPNKRKANVVESSRPSKRQRLRNGKEAAVSREAEPVAENKCESIMWGVLDDLSSDEEDVEMDFTDDNKQLSNLILQRILNSNARALKSPSASPPYNMSPMLTPQVHSVPSSSPKRLETASGDASRKMEWSQEEDAFAGSGIEKRQQVAVKECKEAESAALYAATVCNVSKRVMASVLARVLQVLEDDVKTTIKGKFNRKVNGTGIVRLVCGIVTAPIAASSLPRYLMSLAAQTETLLNACLAFDASPGSYPPSYLRRARRKLATRLQLVGTLATVKHVALTVCYRDRIAKSLFSLLGTSCVSMDVGQSLFSWILDLLPTLHATVFYSRQFELVEALKLPEDLKQRVWTVLPRPSTTASPGLARDPTSGDLKTVDPWGLLEHMPKLPSDALVPSLSSAQPKRRRVYRCV